MRRTILLITVGLMPLVCLAQWLPPANLGDNFNSSVADNTPFVSVGGDTILWTSFRAGGQGSMDIWMSIRQLNGEWGTLQNFPTPVNTSGLEATPCFSPDGQVLFFSTPSQGGEGGWDLFTSTWNGFAWSDPENLGPAVNSTDQDWQPCLSADGSRLYFSSNRGASDDIYYSDWEGTAWSAAQLLPGSVNTDLYDEESPSVTADGSFLCFSTNRPGGLGGVDIWGSFFDEDDSTWSEPVYLGDDLNSAESDQFPAISGDGSFMVIVSNRAGGYGNFDLWLSEYAQTFTVQGTVGLSDSPIDSSGTVVALGDRSVITDVHGAYLMEDVPSGGQTFQFAHDGYEPLDTTIVVSSDVELNVQLVPSPPPISYEDDFEDGLSGWLGSWSLTEESSHSPTHSLTDSPGANYLPNRDMTVTMIRGVDLSDALGAELRFWVHYNIEENFDYCHVEASDDGGNSWFGLRSYTGEQAEWSEEVIDLGGYAGGDNLTIRFRFTSDGAMEEDGIYIDDVLLTGSDVDTTPPLVRHSPVPLDEAVLGDALPVFDIRDVSGVGPVQLFYNPDEQGESVTGPDSIVGEQYYFTIPAQEAGTRVEYRLETIDQADPPNSGQAGPWQYFAGEMLSYDDTDPEFIYEFGFSQALGVRFTPAEQTKLAGLLFYFYQDPAHGLDTVDVHVWSELGGFPDQDLITPKPAYPANTPDQPHAWTFVDLRDRDLEVDGDFVGGCVFRSALPVILGDSPAVENRSFALETGTWGQATADYYVRAIVGDYTSDVPGGVESGLPFTFSLGEPWPNPFNSWCNIQVTLPSSSEARVVIYDVLGRELVKLWDGRMKPGVTRIVWNGKSEAGSPAASGVYFIRLEAGDNVMVRKALLIR